MRWPPCCLQVVDSAPVVGVTRVLKWIRLGDELDLLDAPGVIPAAFNDQIAAQRLAMCNDIGEAAYVDSLIAAAFIIRCRNMPDSGRILRGIQVRWRWHQAMLPCSAATAPQPHIHHNYANRPVPSMISFFSFQNHCRF